MNMYVPHITYISRVELLSKFEVSQRVLSTFYQAVVQRVHFYCFLCYHSSLSAENMNKLECVVKQAAKTIHVTPLRSLHCHYMTKKTENILRDATHPLHTTFIPARSGRQYLSISARTAHYSRSFLPSAIRALNS